MCVSQLPMQRWRVLYPGHQVLDAMHSLPFACKAPQFRFVVTPVSAGRYESLYLALVRPLPQRRLGNAEHATGLTYADQASLAQDLPPLSVVAGRDSILDRSFSIEIYQKLENSSSSLLRHMASEF